MWRSTVRAGCGMLALGLGAGCASGPGSEFSGRPLEDAIVFQPRAYPEGDWTLPPSAEDAWFESGDGLRLHGWFAEAKHPRAVVLYLHGNSGNITSRGDVLELYRDRLGASVLVFDYRGYGRSEGIPTEAGVFADGRAARQWLARRTGVKETDIILVGHSLGGGVATDLAAQDGARGLVLESTFASLPDVAFNHFPLLPYRQLMRSHMDSESKIAHYRGPLLMRHGDDDRIVPYESGKKLFAAANEPKEFITIPGGHHNDAPTPKFLAALDRFIDSAAQRK